MYSLGKSYTLTIGKTPVTYSKDSMNNHMHTLCKTLGGRLLSSYLRFTPDGEGDCNHHILIT
ncbi:hypothetical protein [Enterobacter phage 03_vB_Eclo_IJM]|nr:hypothetical protein [Enterobacter phage 03_vB_Eclo_IJM]